ncbi:hypothetical protein BH18THE2_BH18THE2_19930 [soil metagenome]
MIITYLRFCIGRWNKLEKNFISLRSFVEPKGKVKFCATCGSIATKEALFDVGGGITLIEKYCDKCAKDLTS